MRCVCLFAGVEVKGGEPLRVDPGKDMIVHISLVPSSRDIDFDLTTRLHGSFVMFVCRLL